MSNKVYISNKLARIKDKEAAAKELEKIAKKEMLWGIKKDREKEKEEQNKDKENE
jgi:hypothetical protein